MQAIQTKYIGATNTKHSRIKAACEAGGITVFYDHSLNEDDNHKAAADHWSRGHGVLQLPRQWPSVGERIGPCKFLASAQSEGIDAPCTTSKCRKCRRSF